MEDEKEEERGEVRRGGGKAREVAGGEKRGRKEGRGGHRGVN